jgi:hypothetical protein
MATARRWLTHRTSSMDRSDRRAKVAETAANAGQDWTVNKAFSSDPSELALPGSGASPLSRLPPPAQHVRALVVPKQQ